MKHWDLVPFENVTLLGPGGVAKRGCFVCRDTMHACFMIENQKDEMKWREFMLRDDGALGDAGVFRRVLTEKRGVSVETAAAAAFRHITRIKGKDRNTRTIIAPDLSLHAGGAA